MSEPTDQEVTSWKGRRTTAVNNFQGAVDKVDPLVNEHLGLAVQDLEQLLLLTRAPGCSTHVCLT